MESLIAKMESVQLQSVTPTDMSSDELVSLLTKVEDIKRLYLTEATQYYTKLISDNDNIKAAVTELSKMAADCDHKLALEESEDILHCLIIKKRVLSKVACSTQLIKMMFPDVNWEISASRGDTLHIKTEYGKIFFCVGILFDEKLNVCIKYKSILKRQGYPNVSSFLVKILYNINMCMRLYSSVTLDNMINTVKVAGTVDVKNIDIHWKYKLRSVPMTYSSSDEE